jgi:hypothetical protein
MTGLIPFGNQVNNVRQTLPLSMGAPYDLADKSDTCLVPGSRPSTLFRQLAYQTAILAKMHGAGKFN